MMSEKELKAILRGIDVIVLAYERCHCLNCLVKLPNYHNMQKTIRMVLDETPDGERMEMQRAVEEIIAIGVKSSDKIPNPKPT